MDLNSGCKANGETFSARELQVIKERISKAKNKANLRCPITLMIGVLDENGIIDEG